MTNLVTAAPIRAADRDRLLAAVVTLTTFCAFGGAIRWKAQGYLRRDWLLFVPVDPGEAVPVDAQHSARDLDCDLVAVELASGEQVPLINLGMRLWGRWLWRGPSRLWRDDTGGRCCLVPVHDAGLHLWLESGRIVAHEGLPWRDDADRDLGFARAGAAFRRMVREG